MDCTWTDWILGTSIFVHLAAACYAVALGQRDDLKLRLLIFAGTGFYIAYYAYHPPLPLWDAILWSVVLGLANLRVLTVMVRERWQFRNRSICSTIDGQFKSLAGHHRRLLASTVSRHKVQQDTTLWMPGQHYNHLIFLISGRATRTAGSFVDTIEPGRLLEEQAYILNQATRSTMRIAAGSTYLAFNLEQLNQLRAQHSEIEQAVMEMLLKSMANKLTSAPNMPAIAHRALAAC